MDSWVHYHWAECGSIRFYLFVSLDSIFGKKTTLFSAQTGHSLHSARQNIERRDLDRNFNKAQKLSAMLCIFLLDK